MFGVIKAEDGAEINELEEEAHAEKVELAQRRRLGRQRVFLIRPLPPSFMEGARAITKRQF